MKKKNLNRAQYLIASELSSNNDINLEFFKVVSYCLSLNLSSQQYDVGLQGSRHRKAGNSLTTRRKSFE